MARVRKIEDVGVYIPGARKAAMRDRMMPTDLDGMTEAQIVTDIGKDEVWPKPDYAALVANGMEPKAAALLKIIRDRIPARPSPVRDIPAAANTRAYVEILAALRDEMEQSKTYAELKQSVTRVRSAYFSPGTGTIDFKSVLGKKYASIIANTSPLTMHLTEDLRAKKLVDQRFWEPKEGWRKGFTVNMDGFSRFVVSLKGKGRLAERFETQDAAWEWVKTNGETLRQQAASNKKITPRNRPHLDKLRREGCPDHRNGRDVTAEEFRSRFGFIGVQFGEWLPDKERQVVLNMGYDALMDMADLLGLQPEAISLNGTLAAAFGARGKGNAAAEYDPVYHIFNLTRLKGAGCIVHEWMHALDYYLARGTEVQIEEGIPAASGGFRKLTADQIERLLAHRGSVIAAACVDMIAALERRPLRASEKVEELRKEIDGHLKHAARLDRERQYLEEREPLVGNERKRAKELPTWINNTATLIMRKTEQIEALEAMKPNEIVGTCKSEYLIRAEELDGKRSGEPYYTLPTELLARAFESYLFDRLNADGAVSQYLIHSVTEADYDPLIYHGSPYIGGETRTYMNGVMQRFVEAVRPLLQAEPSPVAKPI